MIYEYECSKCGEVTEVEFSPARKPDHVSCSCGEMAKPIISRPTFILKGNCWAKDGYERHR